MTDPAIFAEHFARTGQVICQICCEAKAKDQMEPVSEEPGKVWDVCQDCAKRDGGEY